MIKETKKKNLSIEKIVLVTFISIMLVSGLIIGTIIFYNWYAYADEGLNEIINRLDKDVFNVVELYMETHYLENENNDVFNNHLKMIVKDKDSIALVIDKNTGELIASSINMDNYPEFESNPKNPLFIDDLGYPSLTYAYSSYTNSKIASYKLNDIKDELYINISEYNRGELDWLIITAIPGAQLTSTIKYNIIYTIFLSSIALILAIIIYFFITRKLLKPMDYLIETTEKFASGDLSHRALIYRNDEIGMITKSFNNMADTIYELINCLELKVKERTLELEKANEIMSDSRNQLKLILNSTGEAIYGMDTAGDCTFCNTSCIKMLGYSHQDELIGKNMHYQIHHSKKDGTPITISECRVVKAITNGTCFHSDDEVFWRKDGTYFQAEYHVYPQFKDDEIVGAVVTFTDITESKKAQEHINYLSTHDPITGVYNRMFFENELIRIDKSKNMPISIIYGDVNGLKLLNDILGHEKGDELLKKTAGIMTKVSRKNDIVARVGGDEFVMLLPNTDDEEAKSIVQSIKTALANEKIAEIKGSISVASATKTTLEQDIKMVLNDAETEMYSVKTLESMKVNSGMLTDVMESLYNKSSREKLHCINVSRISENIAINMNLSEPKIKRVKDAGYYHDIGKIILDKNILNKKGALNEEEMEEMERHPLIGFRLLNLFNETADIAEAVLTHHERWDGSGYPKGLKGEEIPLIARIIAVAEGYDAMTNMVGGNSHTNEEALEEIKAQSGIKYDPMVVSHFTK